MTNSTTLDNHCNDLCKQGHDLYEYGSVQTDGHGYQFIQCRLCNSIRAKEWRNRRKPKTMPVSPTTIKDALTTCWAALNDVQSYLTGETPDQPMSDEELKAAILKNVTDSIKSARAALRSKADVS